MLNTAEMRACTTGHISRHHNKSKVESNECQGQACTHSVKLGMFDMYRQNRWCEDIGDYVIQLSKLQSMAPPIVHLVKACGKPSLYLTSNNSGQHSYYEHRPKDGVRY